MANLKHLEMSFFFTDHSILSSWTNWQRIGGSNCAQDTRNAHDNKLSFSKLGG